MARVRRFILLCSSQPQQQTKELKSGTTYLCPPKEQVVKLEFKQMVTTYPGGRNANREGWYFANTTPPNFKIVND